MANINAVGFNAPKFMPVTGASAAIIDRAVIPGAQAINDTTSLRLPAGVELFAVSVQSTGTVAATVNVGYMPADATSSLAPSLSYFGAAKAVAAGARLRCDFAPITFNEDVIVRLTHTAASTGAGGLVLIAEGNLNGPV